MKQTIENKIRFNIILVYLIAAVICGGMIFFLMNLSEDIDNQKKNVEQYYTDLSQIEELTRLVNEAQLEANLYISTKRFAHLTIFRESLGKIEHQIDSIRINKTDSLPGALFEEFSILLKRKERIIGQLNKQFTNRQAKIPVVHNKLQTDEPELQFDSIQITTTTVRDTVIKSESKRNFLQKVSDIFSRGQKRDTVITITTPVVETMTIAVPDSVDTTSEVIAMTEQVKMDYESRITSIENQVVQLVVADQEISSGMSNLLLQLYSNIIYTRLSEVQKSEEWLRKNNTISIISGIVALLLILLFIILAIRNVNKSLQARKSLEEANILTKQLMDSRHKLLLSVSHDIKTPLNSILGYLELTENAGDLSPKEITSMQRSGKHILSLLENLLEFSSLEQGTLHMTQSAFNLHELCSETVEMFAPLARQKNLVFDSEFNFNHRLSVSSDPLKIKQIIINILSNAVKYTSKGSIRFVVEHRDEELEILVIDSGAGIPEGQLDHIFEPFTRVDKNNTLAEGTGFGMYVVKGLINLLKGTIAIRSTEGKGTTVEILIPAPGVVVTEEAFSYRLVAIDDDPSFLTMLRDMLVRLGHQVLTYSSLSELRQDMEEIKTYDLLLTDLEMGDISGMDVLGLIREQHLNLPVVVMTGRGDFDRGQAVALGFTDYLRKPVGMASLNTLLSGKTDVDDRNEFELLNEMFDNDQEAIREVLNEFVRVTNENIILLEQALSDDNFTRAQGLCHKMLPMCMQVGAEEIIPILKKMDSLRNEAADKFPEWKKEITILIEKVKGLIGRCSI